MVLKIFNKDTNTFQTIGVRVSQSYTDKVGSTNTYFEEFNEADSFQKALDTKISKNGDIIKGTIQFGNGFGISGSSMNEGVYNNSIIKYCESNDSNESGFFRVMSSTKDTEDFDNPTVEDYFNLICDSVPTQNSKNLITSGTLYTLLQNIDTRLTQLETT